MNDPLLMRKQLRVVMSALPPGHQRVTEEFLVAQLNRFFPETILVTELLVALQWNQGKGFVDYHFNSDSERNEWFLTESGRQKEGL